MIRRFVMMAIILLSLALYTADSHSSEEKVITLSLQECIDRALRENLNLKSYYLGIRSEALSVEQAKSSFDPSLSLNIDRNESVQPNYLDYIPVSSIESNVSGWDFSLSQNVITGGSWGFGFYNTLSESNIEKQKNYTSYLGMSITQPLLRGFGRELNRLPIYLARMSSKSAAIDYENMAADLVHTVTNTYWNLVYARATLNVHEIAIAQADSLLAYNRMGLELGVKTQSDVLEAESARVARRQDALLQRNRIKGYEDELRWLIHMTGEQDWGYTIEPENTPAVQEIQSSVTEALAAAFSSRPDYKNALNTLEQNELRHQVSQNALLPSLDLNAGYRINGSGSNYSNDLDDLTDTDAYGWSVGLSLSYPLWNRDAKATSEKRHIDVRRSQLAIEELKEEIETDIRSALRNIDVCREQLEVTKIAVDLNELKLKLEEERFRNNLTSSYYVLEFQRDLADARNLYNKAMIDYILAVADFRKARGTLLADNNISIIQLENR